MLIIQNEADIKTNDYLCKNINFLSPSPLKHTRKIEIFKMVKNVKLITQNERDITNKRLEKDTPSDRDWRKDWLLIGSEMKSRKKELNRKYDEKLAHLRSERNNLIKAKE